MWVLGAPVMTVLGTRISRKRMLMMLMGLFIAGNLLSALAPPFAVMLSGRVVASLAHGAFFGIGMVGGNLVGGEYADRALLPMLYVSLGAVALVLALFTLTAHDKVLSVASIFLIGALGFATVPPLQKRVLDQAHGARRSPRP